MSWDTFSGYPPPDPSWKFGDEGYASTRLDDPEDFEPEDEEDGSEPYPEDDDPGPLVFVAPVIDDSTPF